MSQIPSELKYTSDHEWIRIEDGVATIGITHHAQDQLGDIVFCGDTPDEGDDVDEGDVIAVVESVKANSDVYAPVKGSIAAVNGGLEDEPELVNSDPYGKGWMVRIKLESDDVAGLLSAEQYEALVADES